MKIRLKKKRLKQCYSFWPARKQDQDGWWWIMTHRKTIIRQLEKKVEYWKRRVYADQATVLAEALTKQRKAGKRKRCLSNYRHGRRC